MGHPKKNLQYCFQVRVFFTDQTPFRPPKNTRSTQLFLGYAQQHDKFSLTCIRHAYEAKKTIKNFVSPFAIKCMINCTFYFLLMVLFIKRPLKEFGLYTPFKHCRVSKLMYSRWKTGHPSRETLCQYFQWQWCIQFRTAVTVYRCLHGTASEYLSELFVPASTRSSHHCLRSSDSNKLVVPPVKLYIWTAFFYCIMPNCVEQPSRIPQRPIGTFRRYLKTYFFARY